MTQSKTEMAIQKLLEHEEISNRGHAFIILKEAGLSGSGAVFNKAVKAWEEVHGALGKSAAAKLRDKKQRLRAHAHQMSADEVIEHINDIDSADDLFWACWNVFKYEGKWARKLKCADFAVHFNK